MRRSSSARFVHSPGCIKKEKIPLASRLRAALLPRPRRFTFNRALKPECIPQCLTSSVSLRLPPSPEGKAFIFSFHRGIKPATTISPFGPAGHFPQKGGKLCCTVPLFPGCRRHPALRAPARGATLHVKTCNRPLFMPTSSRTSSTAYAVPLPRVQGCDACEDLLSRRLFFPARPWISSTASRSPVSLQGDGLGARDGVPIAFPRGEGIKKLQRSSLEFFA